MKFFYMLFKLLIVVIVSIYKFNPYVIEKYTIDLEEIFNQKIQEYHVLFYLDECMSCSTLIDYIKSSKIYQKVDIFYINLKGLDEKIISCQQNNIGVTNYLDLRINKSPTLLVIDKEKVINQIEGLTPIHLYLENYTKF